MIAFVRRRRRTVAHVMAAVLVIMLIECVGFNLPFWTTLAASTDTASSSNTLGPGLQRRDDGMLVVTDPTQAYLEVSADGSSSYARIDVSPPEVIAAAEDDDSADEDSLPQHTVLVRADGESESGHSTSVCIDASRSLYLRVQAEETVRLWIEEPEGTVIPFAAVRANVRVPFSVDLIRVAVMAFIALLIALWRPGSRLWRITLDTSSRRQRVTFAAIMLPFAAVSLGVVIWYMLYMEPLSFHKDGAYTYDFEQYGRLADALIDGHLWVDLPVDDALTQVTNPYDVNTRNELLADGVTLYWDYAYYNGHWYTYFGVLPAIVLFVPYRLLTGKMLPSGAAEYLLMFGFLVCASLLVIRLIRRLAPRTSLAATSIAVVFVLLASNAPYLWFRSNFYSVPCAASMLLSTLGLWLWLGASMPRKRPAKPDAPPLKCGHLAGGALCIAANFGCRPAFCLVALLAVPLFWPQITQLCHDVIHRTTTVRKALRMPLAVVLPALAIVIPLMAYNAARFGSPVDFGNTYQFTVTDMTSFTPSVQTLLQLIFYYVLLPLRVISQFPFLSLSPTPLYDWAYTEEMIGGAFWLCPLMVLACALPFLRRRTRRSGCWAMLLTGLVIAAALVVFDAWAGGLGWRYMVDFCWLIALAALPALLMLVNEHTRDPWSYTTGNSTRSSRSRNNAFLGNTDISNTHEADCCSSSVWACRAGLNLGDATMVVTQRHHVLLWLRRTIVLLLLGFSFAVTVLGFFVPGRDDALLTGNPMVYHTVAAWFL